MKTNLTPSDAHTLFRTRNPVSAVLHTAKGPKRADPVQIARLYVAAGKALGMSAEFSGSAVTIRDARATYTLILATE